MENPLVSIIIVTYNSENNIERCLDSIRNSSYRNFEVIIIDNNSQDNSVDLIRKKFPQVKLIDYTTNLGFAEANNRAFLLAKGKYFFLLNPDTFIDKDSIKILVRTLEKNEEIAIGVPKLKFAYDPTTINNIGIVANKILYGWDRGFLEKDKGQYDRQTEVIAGTGAALFFRKFLINQIGSFDKKYFMYYEDLDFGIRTLLAGYKILTIPGAVVYHKLIPEKRKEIFNQYYDHRNRLRTVLKNMSIKTLIWMVPISLLFDAKSISRYLYRAKFKWIFYRIRALLWNVLKIPDIYQERKKIQRIRVNSDEVILSKLVKGFGYPRLNQE